MLSKVKALIYSARNSICYVPTSLSLFFFVTENFQGGTFLKNILRGTKIHKFSGNSTSNVKLDMFF